jgi:hypothetical protein
VGIWFAVVLIPPLPASILWLGATSPDSVRDPACSGLHDSVRSLPWGRASLEPVEPLLSSPAAAGLECGSGVLG